MTSQPETCNFDINHVDLLQKKFSEEKKAHGETILQLISAQAQAQTAEAQAAKAQELVAETTLKLDQAREEIRGLRDQAQEAQTLAQETQANITDLEVQMAQMKVMEQSQTAIEAQAQELQEAHAKIASLESRMVKARADLDVATNPEPRDETLELKAKIENLEAQVAQMKIFEQFQAQSQKLKAAQEKITKLEAQMAHSEKHAQEDIRKLEAAQAQVKDLKSQVSQAQEEIQSLRAQVQKLEKPNAHAQKSEAQMLQEAQAMIRFLQSQIPEPKVQVPPRWSCEFYALSPQTPDQWFFITQNDRRTYFQEPFLMQFHVICKFVSDKPVILELAGLELKPTTWFRVSISDGKRYETVGQLGPNNRKLLIGELIWSLILRQAPFRTRSNGNKEYQLAICCEELPNDPAVSSS